MDETLEVEVGALLELASATEDVAAALAEAVGALADAPAAGLGHPALDEAVAGFHDRWHTQARSTGQDTGAMAGRLRATADAYAGTDAATATGMGGN